ncbi:MAG: DUF370 domain-containing protein [Clostridia bacterium]|jgi:hypothetical protein|nr:DUF370 domain-containing protein [Clostridia bacterium]NLF36951.1 DUF370 domain-containing protein [Clostridiaceae bacterium]MDD3093840.1 DUF370 domain-containing protein [Clostridia bacterium]MDD3972271.1 DUF370 domain-containing protein [Clostridia bacterium]MDD4542430.1 DUF370 domain-containing protein [Clostridia bacterium]
MFLHIGDDLVLREQDIIGIFDFETSTLSKHTKKYLQDKEKKHSTLAVSEQIPKAFVVVQKKEQKEPKVYFTLVSSITLKKRAENNRLME